MKKNEVKIKSNKKTIVIESKGNIGDCIGPRATLEIQNQDYSTIRLMNSNKNSWWWNDVFLNKIPIIKTTWLLLVVIILLLLK